MSTCLLRAERRAAPKPARIPSGDRPTYSSAEGLSVSRPVRPVHLLGAHAFRCLEDLVSRALEPWMRDWVREGVAHGVQVRASTAQATDVPQFVAWSAPAGTIWIRHAEHDAQRLAHAVLGAEFLPLPAAADAWPRDLLSQAAECRDRRLAQMLLGDAAEPIDCSPDPRLFVFGSGAVQLTCDALGLHVLADRSVLRHVPPRPRKARAATPQVSLPRAAQRSRLALWVHVGSVELDVAALLGLRFGDVIRLAAPLTELLTVQVNDQVVARAALGRCGHRKAVRLHSV